MRKVALFAWLISRTFSANEQYFSLITNQPTVLSAMAYQPSEQGSLAVSIHKILSAQFWMPIGLDCSCKATEEHVKCTPGQQTANAILNEVEKREEGGVGRVDGNSTRYIKTD